jgi:hypothetical protein
MTRPFTAHDAKTMTPEEIITFWRDRQIANREAGLDHHTVLIDVRRDGTETVVATIDQAR